MLKLFAELSSTFERPNK